MVERGQVPSVAKFWILLLLLSAQSLSEQAVQEFRRLGGNGVPHLDRMSS